MKVLGIVGTPHRKMGNTYRMVRKIMEGAEGEGAKTEIVLLSDWQINYCAGCALCLREGECPQKDDMKKIKEKMVEADGIVLGSPVYVLHVTAQMKTFIDRCLSFGHRPSLFGKYGVSVSVFAGVGDVKKVADYMNDVLRGFGVAPVGAVCGFAVKPGDVDEDVLERCFFLGKELASAISGKKACPKIEDNDEFLRFKRQMRNLIVREKDFMKADYEYWKKKGWIEVAE